MKPIHRQTERNSLMYFFIIISALLVCNMQLVLNLCDKLEEMETPSSCEDG